MIKYGGMTTDHDRGTELIRLARGAVEQELGTAEIVHPGHEWLGETGATFVTLEKEGDLRGCIGTIEAFRSLYDDVTDNARAAAFRDPRFRPVKIDEWPSITIEISLLTPPARFPVSSQQELIEKLQPGIHGLVLKEGYRQATFLPSVWEQLPDPRDFVTHLKRKAGIPLDHWSDKMEVSVYTVEKFSETPP
ncbi:MAG: AmmeMemoRadiSam system protein A [Thermoanaerobaculia bacterium]|nr:AmmeMemoRadiSam system protein A [Thermoanaerobaculia bacterium]